VAVGWGAIRVLRRGRVMRRSRPIGSRQVMYERVAAG